MIFKSIMTYFSLIWIIDEFRMVLGGEPTPFLFLPIVKGNQILEIGTNSFECGAPNKLNLISFPPRWTCFATSYLSLMTSREKKGFRKFCCEKKRGVAWPPKTMRNSSVDPLRLDRWSAWVWEPRRRLWAKEIEEDRKMIGVWRWFSFRLGFGMFPVTSKSWNFYHS